MAQEVMTAVVGVKDRVTTEIGSVKQEIGSLREEMNARFREHDLRFDSIEAKLN